MINRRLLFVRQVWCSSVEPSVECGMERRSSGAEGARGAVVPAGGRALVAYYPGRCGRGILGGWEREASGRWNASGRPT